MLTILQWTNTTPVISKEGIFSPFLSVLILNVILFSILFTYNLFERLSIFHYVFLKYTENNTEYVI